MALLRKCPYCKEQGVDSAHIYDGARCLFCLKIIELDHFYVVLLLIISVLCVKFLFDNSYGFAGLILTVVMVVFSSGYKQITSKFFPLKTYEK
tara:strand:+ start:895 stop:1173 length:279 start_codon:yes stop_codon:yes gene_type:complete